jgi:carbonic anhydrase
MSRAVALIPLVLLAAGCSKFAEAQAEEPAHGAASAAPSTQKPGAGHGAHAEAETTGPGTRYGVPFGWELSKDEPLAQARSYLSEMLTDNALNAGLGKEHFAKFADKQAPRATVVTCSDSRVQSSAWDRTPENDAFTIRNIGNQVTTAHGSVEYGLEHLHTPVLFILGHTGCGAVKAAMGKLDGLEAPIKAELSGLKLPPTDPKLPERKAWANAVVANVNAQVDFAVTHFGKLLREQKVSVVGAVYDFRNDLGRGAGRISVVNVNGNTEPKRLRAFESALDATPHADSNKLTPTDQLIPGGPRDATLEAPLAGMLKEAQAPRPEPKTAPAEAHGEHGH